jgi:hypothetical protein
LEAPNDIAALNPQALANTLWAFATAGVAAPALFGAIDAEAQKKIATFSPRALADTVWAYAKAGLEAPLLFEAVALEASKRMAAFKPQALARTAWAYAAASDAPGPLFDALALRIEAAFEDFSPDGLAQLHQVYVYLQLEAPRHALTLLLSRREAELRAAYLAEERPSRLQLDVSAALNRVGWDHVFEHVTAQGLAVEVDVSSDYVASSVDGVVQDGVASVSGASTRDGESRFKERLLRKLGWELIRVPYLEWAALKSSAKRDEYARRITQPGS